MVKGFEVSPPAGGGDIAGAFCTGGSAGVPPSGFIGLTVFSSETVCTGSSIAGFVEANAAMLSMMSGSLVPVV